jgi:hypothetical protein
MFGVWRAQGPLAFTPGDMLHVLQFRSAKHLVKKSEPNRLMNTQKD